MTSGSTVQQTHPYLNFEVRLDRAPWQALLLLGEAKSKVEHISNAPTLPEVQEQMHLLYLTKGIHATTAIEGNTLSEDEVRQIVERTFKSPPSQEYQATEVQNILDICNAMSAVDWRKPVSEQDICTYNLEIQRHLEVDEHVVPGDYRTYVVMAGGYRAPLAQDVPALMRRFTGWLEHFNVADLGNDKTLHLTILKAVYAHLFFVWIHPFGDGTGRTARILELRILLASGVPTLVAHLLSNHYNKTRTMYYRKLTEAQHDPWNFVSYALQGLVDGLAEQIGRIQEQQRIVLWGHLVRSLISGDTPAASRKRTLARELANINRPVRKSEIAQLSIELAGKYAGKTQKSVSRDIKELEELKLVHVGHGQIVTNWERLLQLLPSKVQI